MAKMVLEQGVDMVVGDRLSSTYFTENKRPFHNFGNSLVRKSINSLFKSDVKDIMTGLRAFSYGFVKTFPVISKGFEIETEMTIHAIDKNMFIKNVCERYNVKTIGAFTFAHNNASIRVLEKNGFVVIEEFEEDGVLSKYLQYEC